MLGTLIIIMTCLTEQSRGPRGDGQPVSLSRLLRSPHLSQCLEVDSNQSLNKCPWTFTVAVKIVIWLRWQKNMPKIYKIVYLERRSHMISCADIQQEIFEDKTTVS